MRIISFVDVNASPMIFAQLYIILVSVCQMISALRMNGNGHKFELNFVKYAQSSRCVNNKDSSVSYASASLTIQ